MTPEFIATPRGRPDQYPWRPMDNRERRAAWAVKYYMKHRPGRHDLDRGAGLLYPGKGETFDVAHLRVVLRHELSELGVVQVVQDD